MHVLQREKRWIKTADYFDFNSYSLPAGVGNNYNVISEKVPQNLVLRITGIETYVNLYADWSNVQWDFRIDGIGRTPLSNRTDQIGSPGNPARIPPDALETRGGHLFTVNISQLDAAAAHVGGVVLTGEWGYYEKA